MHFLLFYDFVPDYLDKRDEHRSEHLSLGRPTSAASSSSAGPSGIPSTAPCSGSSETARSWPNDLPRPIRTFAMGS